MNEHIALVKKWIEDNDSVSHEELSDNATQAAKAAYAADWCASDPALSDKIFDDWDAAAEIAMLGAVGAPVAAARWIERYEKLTNER